MRHPQDFVDRRDAGKRFEPAGRAQWHESAGLRQCPDLTQWRAVHDALADLVVHLHDERRPDAVVHVVGDVRGDDLATQSMALDGRTKSLLQRLRKIEREIFDEQRFVRQITGQQIGIEDDLAVREKYRELRARETGSRGMAIGRGTLLAGGH